MLWIEGPKFLQQSESYWPQISLGCSLNFSDFTVATLCEIKTEFKSKNMKIRLPLMSYYSNYNRLIRSTCYILRVFRVIAARIKSNDERKSFLSLHISPLITVDEHKNARA